MPCVGMDSSPEAVETAGRFISKTWEKYPPERKPLRVLVLGQCTTPWLSISLVSIGLKHHAVLDVTDGPYDNVLQELMNLAAGGERYDIAVLLPWNTRLLGGGDRSAAQRIGDELDFWSQVWSRVRDLGARLVQVGYDLMTPGLRVFIWAVLPKANSNSFARPTHGCVISSPSAPISSIWRISPGIVAAGSFIAPVAISGPNNPSANWEPRFWLSTPGQASAP